MAGGFGISMKIVGIEELINNAGKAEGMVKTLLTQAMGRSVTILKNEARAIKSGSFKNQTGNLRRSIFTKVSGWQKGIVGVGEEYGKYVEYGTTAHTIVPKRGKVLAFKGAGGRMVFASKVNHPGSKPYPFMKPALENKADEVVDEYVKVRSTISKVLAA